MMVRENLRTGQLSGFPCFLFLMTAYLLAQAGIIRTVQAALAVAVFLWAEKKLGENKGSHFGEDVIFMFFFLWVIHNTLYKFLCISRGIRPD